LDLGGKRTLIMRKNKREFTFKKIKE